MVDRSFRGVTLPAELQQYHFSPEKEEVILINEALIDKWKSSPDNYVSSVKVLQEQDRKSKIAISSPAKPVQNLNKSANILLPKPGVTPQNKATETTFQEGIIVPLKRTSLGGTEEGEETPKKYKFRVVSPPVSKTSSTSVRNDSQAPRNGSVLRISLPSGSVSSNSIESTTGILQRPAIHSSFQTLVLTPIKKVMVVNKACQNTQPTIVKPVMHNSCGQCKKLSEACDCGKNAITYTVISSTCQPFQTAENIRRKSQAAKKEQSMTLITKQSFYSKKLNDQYKVLVSPADAAKKTLIASADSTAAHVPNIIRKRPRLGKPQEPECLTISSDEEEFEKQMSDSLDIPEFPETNASNLEALANRHERMRDKHGNIIVAKQRASSSLLKKEIGIRKSKPVKKNILKQRLSSNILKKETTDGGESKQLEDKKGPEHKLQVNCRSIRIGSYKLHPSDYSSLPATFTKTSISFSIPTVADNEMVTVVIQYEDIASILAHFGKALPVLFIYTTPDFGEAIRSKLQMTDKKINYYDPCSEDETCKRITFLPDGITEDERDTYRLILPVEIIKEVSQVQANEILVRSVPVNPQVRYVGQRMGLPITRSQTTAATKVIVSSVQPRPVVKLLTYPPLPQTGGIAITSEDLECLNPLEFLNDVIIDFYLKYLVMEKLTDEERQRIHVFSSFFYPRLTQKPISRGSTEEICKLTPQKKRHSSVKTWTKNIDIFQKDYIIVPINQNAHWFLAIICFPGRVPAGKPNAESNSSAGNKQATDTSPANISSPDLFDNTSNTVGPNDEAMEIDARNQSCKGDVVKQDDPESPIPPKPVSLVPYESGDDSSDGVGSNAAEEPVSSVKGDMNSPYILIFDSLPGPSRWRIVSTLREYLEVEYETKKGSKRSFDRETMKGINVRVPVQSNFSDCGVFLLQYVESFFEDMSNWPKFELWFDEALIAKKRDSIKELILDLQKRCNSSNSSTNGRSSSDEVDDSVVSCNITSPNISTEENS